MNILDKIMKPRSIAVVGASTKQHTIGSDIMKRLREYGYAGLVYPVNPKGGVIEGLPAYATVLDIPSEVDLAVIIVNARFVLQTIDQCHEKGIKGLCVISAGFKETGTEGARLEAELLERVRRYGMRCVGPNCLGVVNTHPAVRIDGTETAMSSATIIDYLLDRMKAEEKLSDGALRNLEVKQIPIRLQMLQTGKAATAMLPEPLVSVVEAKGGRVIWDDRGLNEALAVVALKKDRLDDKTVAAFRGAVADAARLIESEPDRFRAVMVKKGLLPAPVAQNYTMVRFSMFGTNDGLPPLPSAEDVRRVGEWMVGKNMIKAVPAYDSVVIRP